MVLLVIFVMMGNMETMEPEPVTDEWGHEMGHCNSCGEEAEMGSECCEDGEIEPSYVDEEG